jgi:dTDP-4-amino-4,6-dideoxygalactose transaminase
VPSRRSTKTQSPLQTPAARVPVVDFARQYEGIREEILAAIASVCDRQHFILGEEVGQFESAAAELCGARFGIGCASGTDALWLALTASEIGVGEAVLTTPFSFFSTVSSILRAGAKPRLADIDPRTFNLDPTKAVELLRQKAGATRIRAILAVDLYGQCADWDAFRGLAAEHRVLLIEDAAQAFGAKWNGQPAGSLGDVGAFSFYPTKNLGAFGDAGLVTTSNEGLAERVRLGGNHGMRRRYFHDEMGWNSRMDTIQAAVLLVKLRHIEEWNRQRRERARTYDELFRQRGLAEAGPYPDHGVVLPWVDPRATHVFHQYVIRVPRRDQIREFLGARGISSEIYYPVPLHQQAAFRHLVYKEGSFPESERAAREVLALPIFPELRPDEQDRVVGAIADFLS